MSESEIKVTDRRMFTPDGELRPEFQFLESAEPAPAAPPAAPVVEEPPRSEAPRIELAGASPTPELLPDSLALPGAPTFFDLLGLLAEPISVYLGDLALPDGSSGEDPEMARLHIDLLVLLRHKTRGNLTAEEAAVLDDLLYQLQMRYVERKR